MAIKRGKYGYQKGGVQLSKRGVRAAVLLIYLFPAYGEGSVNFQFTIIIDLFTLRLGGEDYKYSIHDDNEFIHLPLMRRGV